MSVLNIAYDVTASDGPTGTIELIEVRHKCVGDCKGYLEQTVKNPPKAGTPQKAANTGKLLKGQLVMDGQTLHFVRSDGEKNDFVAQSQK